MTTGNVLGGFSGPSLGRQQIATVRDVPVSLWRDLPAREALWQLTIEAAREIAAARGMTVADQKPHEVTPVFGHVIELGDQLAFAETTPDQASVVRVRACWWATP